ncbi:MAG: acyltransferase [Mucilaginibacter sp.]
MLTLKIFNYLRNKLDHGRSAVLCFLLRLLCSKRLKMGKVFIGRHFSFNISSKQCQINIGDKVCFRKNATLRVRQGAQLTIGRNVFFNDGLSINCHGIISIADDCMFGENVRLYDHNHRFRNNDTPIIKQGFTVGKIAIGRNCWIGSNVVILKNVTIGDNVVIGANCLIMADVPSNTIVKNNIPLTQEAY